MSADAYGDALARLYELTRMGERLDLETPRALDAALGHPLGRYRSVLVAGTNGKGSTCAFLEALLRRAGLRVGLFSSPHLVSFRERIRVDGVDISESGVPPLVDRVLGLGLEPSFFEAAWAMAALYFADAGVDLVVWEVGLGGRLDATNVCEPEVSAVVSVALDHTHLLGDTIEAIAAEKAPVFRPGRPALTAATGAALDALRRLRPDVRSAVPVDVPVPLPGAHQRSNAGLAVAIAEALGVDPDTDALGSARWPGRGERIGDVLLDCAHNPDGAGSLAAWLPEPMDVVFGASEGKDVAGMAAALAPVARTVTLVTPRYPRCVPAPSIAHHFPGATVGTTVAAALDGRRGPVLVCGSAFLVGEARAHLLGLEFPERGLLTTAR